MNRGFEARRPLSSSPLLFAFGFVPPSVKAFCPKKLPGGDPQELSSSPCSTHTHARHTPSRGGTLRPRESPVGTNRDAIRPGRPAQGGRGRRAVRLWPRRPRKCAAPRGPGCQQMRPPQEGQGRGRVGGGRLDGLEAVPEGLVWSPIRGSFIHISLPRRSNKKYLVFWPPASQRRAGSMPLNA